MKKALIFVFLILSANLIAQPTQSWVAQYDRIHSEDDSYQIAIDRNGEYVYVTGKSYKGGQCDIVTIKYNTVTGNQVWLAMYSGYGYNDVGTSIAVDDAGNVYVTGYSDRTGGGNNEIVTIKYNSDGIQQWAQTYNERHDDRALSIALDRADNIFITGFVSNSINVDGDYVTIKYSNSGERRWISHYNGPGNGDDQAQKIVVDRNGYAYVTGFSTGQPEGYDFATICYEPVNGNQFWVARYEYYPITTNNKAYAIAVDDYMCAYVTGGVGQPDNTLVATIKYYYDDSGVHEAWVNIFYPVIPPIPGRTHGTAIALYRRHCGTDMPCWEYDTYVTGCCNVHNQYTDFVTIKYDPSGNEQWAQTYDGPVQGYDYSNAISLDFWGNAYVTGSTYTYPKEFPNIQYTTIMYSSNGIQNWVMDYQTSWDNRANSIVVHDYYPLQSVDVYVTGSSFSFANNYDYATIKYSYSGSDKNSSIKLNNLKDTPDEFRLKQNYPNPFNSMTDINYSIPFNTKVVIKIYNILGQEISELVNDFKTAGFYTVKFNANDLTSGIYFYKIQAGNYSEVKKMLLVK
jgi:hypothetical protein